jgi:2-polyprenyl-3-methyl-5-hydroxy-6-metoxy-1,4-benzoquinol methylase
MKRADWYKHGWSLDIKNQSWTEDTENQVNFIVQTLELSGKERVLDLACGYGRHSLSFAHRGFAVTGVDITKAFIDDAIKSAREQNLSVTFIHADIREISFCEEFDVVLNLADGAIGYLENDEENLKIFDVIAKVLKPGGKHFMDVCNADHAGRYFPKKNWEIGEKALALAQFEWNPITRCMTYAGWDVPYGEVAQKPRLVMENANPYRLYSLEELKEILKQRNMNIVSSFSNYDGKESTATEMQLLVYSKRKGE